MYLIVEVTESYVVRCGWSCFHHCLSMNCLQTHFHTDWFQNRCPGIEQTLCLLDHLLEGTCSHQNLQIPESNPEYGLQVGQQVCQSELRQLYPLQAAGCLKVKNCLGQLRTPVPLQLPVQEVMWVCWQQILSFGGSRLTPVLTVWFVLHGSVHQLSYRVFF